MGLKPAADREDGPLQVGRDALDDMACPRQVVQPIGAEFEIATPPLAEPGFGAAQCLTDGVDRATAEAGSNSTLTCHEFVVHGNLRGAAASGCPRRSH